MCALAVIQLHACMRVCCTSDLTCREVQYKGCVPTPDPLVKEKKKRLPGLTLDLTSWKVNEKQDSVFINRAGLAARSGDTLLP